jgi:hypothetical protein
MLNIDDDDDEDPASVMDEERAYTNRRGNLHPPKAMIEREPEGEPELEESRKAKGGNR